jgi:hypothetical protein
VAGVETLGAEISEEQKYTGHEEVDCERAEQGVFMTIDRR